MRSCTQSHQNLFSWPNLKGYGSSSILFLSYSADKLLALKEKITISSDVRSFCDVVLFGDLYMEVEC